MPSYRVEWAIDIDADTPKEAAEKAFAHMKAPDTTATVFDVFDDSGEVARVDLLEERETL